MSGESRRLQLNPERGRNWLSGLSMGIWSAYLLWRSPRALDPYRNFDGEQSTSFKSGKFSLGGTIMPRKDISWELGYPRLRYFRTWFYHWRQYFWTNFVTPRPARKIILGTLLHGRVPRTVSLDHRILGMPLLAGRPVWDSHSEKRYSGPFKE